MKCLMQFDIVMYNHPDNSTVNSRTLELGCSGFNRIALWCHIVEYNHMENPMVTLCRLPAWSML